MISAPEGAAMSDTAVRFGAFVAEFGGSLYLSSLNAVLDKSSRIEGHPDRHDYVDRRAKITCACGASSEWDIPVHGGVFAYQYVSPPADPDRGVYLTIVRAPATKPMCEHWHELPLRFSAP